MALLISANILFAWANFARADEARRIAVNIAARLIDAIQSYAIT
jgi:hypothetical protein